MLQVIAPVFLVIFTGYIFGRKNRYAPEAERLINDYALYIALPAYLFLAIAATDPAELMHGSYIFAAFLGVAFIYGAGLLLARLAGIRAPMSSIVGMSCSFGNTGYMGIPLITAILGQEAAPAASIIWVLHNIPTLVAVIVTYDLAGGEKRSIAAMILKALGVAFKNPLTIAVLMGVAFSVLRVPLPEALQGFARMLGGAAGPTALFAMGLGLSRITLHAAELKRTLKLVAPVVFLKMILHPVMNLLFLIPFVGFAFGDIWFMTSLIMAALPVGVVSYIFATRYGFFEKEASIAIILSQILIIGTLPALLYLREIMIP